MPSSNGSLSNQPIDSIEGIIAANGLKGLSANMKSTVTFVRAQITRSFTAAGKKLDAAKCYMNDPIGNLNEKELRKIDFLRKEIMMLQSVIETDSHFVELVNKREVILSEKERNALKDVISDYFAGKPRAEVSHDLKTANDALRAILVTQEFMFEPLLSDAELAELSHELASFLDDGDDKPNDGDNNSEHEEIDELRHFQSDPKDTPILATGAPTVRSSTASILMSAVADGGLPFSHEQPVATPQIIHVRSPLQEQITSEYMTVPNTQNVRQPTPIPKDSVVRSCPCCRQDHELYSCKHEDIQKFCAVNKRCIYCTSNKHKSSECDLVSQRSSRASSIASIRSRRSSKESCITPPLEASTLYGYGNEKPVQSTRVSMRKMAQRERMIQERCQFTSAFTPLFEKPEFGDSKDANYREASERKEAKHSDDSIKLSFKEVLAIVSPFEGDPLDFPRFKEEFDSMVMLNNQLNDTMKLAVLKKKLIGEAKEYLVALYNPRQAVFETLGAMHKAFSEDNTAMNSVLQSFRELTFNSVDFRQTAKELNQCKSILLQMKELGLDTESNTFVRTFVAKIPDRILRDLRVLFVNGREPSTREVLAHFTESLDDLTFPDKFKSGTASSQGRLNELPNSIMTLDAPLAQKPRQKKQTTGSGKNNSKSQKPSSTPTPGNPSSDAQITGAAQQHDNAPGASNGSGQMNVTNTEYFQNLNNSFRDYSETHE